MIYGIGVDLVSVARIQSSLERHGERFFERVLHEAERPRLAGSKSAANLLAKSFAATEAFSKALGTGVRGFRFNDVGIVRDELGRPQLIYSARVQALLDVRGIVVSHLSLSDDAGLVTAMVVLECRPPAPPPVAESNSAQNAG